DLDPPGLARRRRPGGNRIPASRSPGAAPALEPAGRGRPVQVGPADRPVRGQDGRDASLLVVRGKGGLLRISDGVTRATRVADLLPGQTVTVEVIEDRPNADFSKNPTVGDKLP